ncbi:GerMN domain-containing protein [Alkaliphilus crotonatoxidans]
MGKKLTILLLILVMGFTLTACKKDQKEVMEEEPDQNVTDPVEETEEPEELFYVLYLKHKELPYIFADTFNISADDPRLEGKLFEEFVLEELIHQSAIEDLINPIPEGTKILSVKKEGKTVLVDLSEEFIGNMKGTEEDVMATVAVIVNSLTTLPNNDKVQILVEGKAIDNLRGADISQDFEFIPDFYADK